jgi:hypothetical protein
MANPYDNVPKLPNLESKDHYPSNLLEILEANDYSMKKKEFYPATAEYEEIIFDKNLWSIKNNKQFLKKLAEECKKNVSKCAALEAKKNVQTNVAKKKREEKQ